MANKLVFMWDFLYHNPMCDGTYHYYAVDIFKPLVKLATGLEIVELRTLKNSNGEVFSRQKFYDLSDYSNIEKSYFSYDIKKIKQPSIDYLKTFIDQDTFIFGFELGLELRKILTNLNINFINFWYHSWKLFDDAFLMINTNNNELYNKLNKYKVPIEKFSFYANYWKHFTKQKGELDYLNDLMDNSCLFVGQTMRDKSTDRDGVMLNILHFKDRILELSSKYSKIYYIPHPYAQYNEELEQYLKETDYIEKLENIGTYHLLMSDKIQKVVGISSSVLYEAQFFGKEIEYLYKPLFSIDGEYSLETFISIFDDYYNPYFWADLLSVVMPTNLNIKNEVWFNDISNKFRNINHLYYGYQNFNENYRLKNSISKETDIKISQLKTEIILQNDNYSKNFLEIYKLLNLLNNKQKVKQNYYKYKILANFVFGKTRERYKNKKTLYKQSLDKINSLQDKLL